MIQAMEARKSHSLEEGKEEQVKMTIRNQTETTTVETKEEEEDTDKEMIFKAEKDKMMIRREWISSKTIQKIPIMNNYKKSLHLMTLNKRSQ